MDVALFFISIAGVIALVWYLLGRTKNKGD